MAPRTRNTVRYENFLQPVMPNTDPVSEVEIREVIEIVKHIPVRKTKQKAPSSRLAPPETRSQTVTKTRSRTPTATRSKTPTTTRNKNPTTTRSKAPTTTRSRTPATTRSRTPATTRSRTPATTNSRTPAATRSRTPATTRCKTTTNTVSKATTTSRNKNPTTSRSKAPPTTLCKNPPKTRNKTPTTTRSKTTTNTRSKIPAKTRSKATENICSKAPTKSLSDDDGDLAGESEECDIIVVPESKTWIVKKEEPDEKNTDSEEAPVEITIDEENEPVWNFKQHDDVVEISDDDDDIESIECDDDGTTETQSDSSSAEDSEDDYELEMGIKKKKESSESDSSIHASYDEDEDYKLRWFEKKMEQKSKKSRLLLKMNHDDDESDDDGIICEFESRTIRKDRKKRLFRRRMMRIPGQNKRRRIRRDNVNVTEEYTCDTFSALGSILDTLTTDIELDDPDVNHKALRKVFIEMEIDSEESCDEPSDDDEADIICKRLNFYDCRNSKERIEQISCLNINQFVEKLSGYDNRKAEEGNSELLARNYHPSFFDEGTDWKLPEVLIWKRPYEHVFFQETQLDPSRKARLIIDKGTEERHSQLKSQLLEQIKERARKKLLNLKIAAPMKLIPKPERIFSQDDVVMDIRDDMMLLNRPAGTHSMPAEEVEMLKYNGNRSDDDTDSDSNSLHFDEDIFA